jgi:hypothetical protein
MIRRRRMSSLKLERFSLKVPRGHLAALTRQSILVRNGRAAGPRMTQSPVTPPDANCSRTVFGWMINHLSRVMRVPDSIWDYRGHPRLS